MEFSQLQSVYEQIFISNTFTHKALIYSNDLTVLIQLNELYCQLLLQL